MKITSGNRINPGVNKTGISTAILLVVVLLSACTPVVYEQTTSVPPPPPPVQVVYVAPAWAPPCNNIQQVQYYFLPDIDVYYNAGNQLFVYYDGYNWVNTQYLPSAYASYDLNSAYVVYLDYNTVNPWVNNTVYVQHYPRYYYNSYYGNQQYYNNQPIRGYSENINKPVYAPRGNYYRSTGNSGINTQPQNGSNWNGNQQQNNSGNSGIYTPHNNNNTGNSGINTQQQNNGNQGGGYYSQPNNSGNSGINVPHDNNNTGNSGINTQQQNGYKQTEDIHKQQPQQTAAPYNYPATKQPQNKNMVGQPVKPAAKPVKKAINNKPAKKNTQQVSPDNDKPNNRN